MSIAPIEFMDVSKGVKLMTMPKGIRVQQYLDDWLDRVCLQHTQALVRMCQELGWLVNLEKSAVLVPDRAANSHRKTSSPWPTAYKTHSVASQKQL